MTFLRYGQHADVKWKWNNGTEFTEYSFQINEQIETAYLAYLRDNKKNELFLKFPYNDKPRTHIIDLNKGEITDLTSNKIQKIQQKDGYYYIGQEQADDSLNLYIEMKSKKKQIFTILLENYKICFTSKDGFYKINLDTNTKIELQRDTEKYSFIKYLRNLINNKLNAKAPQLIQEDNQVYCSALTFLSLNEQNEKGKTAQNIQNAIWKILEKYEITFELKLPMVNDLILLSFINYLQKITLSMDGVLIQNNTLSLKCFENGLKLIQEAVEHFNQVPQSWDTCSYICIYFIDDVQFDEEVQQSFPFLNIKEIQLIENYDFWAKYLSKKKSLEGWDEQLLLFGSQNVCPQEIFGKVNNSLPFDYQKGPYLKCGNTMDYVKDNYCVFSEGEKQIFVLQVLLGEPQDLNQQFIISDYALNNYKEGEIYYVKRDRVYSKFLITLKE
ncbi:unnamed protein product [Paramecium octaurelia]|uniref:Uncharacterized protein n=1 Tax=Paramecium octaurelia TaxID=43137 RepID=A0A8S1XDV7_PAROT|nr:unnamed protein product [Paramecium octaurelia]